jgi:hypothetical protein
MIQTPHITESQVAAMLAAQKIRPAAMFRGEPARKPPKPRKPTLASVARQASKAAIDVARYEVKPDGTIVVITGTGEQQQSNELDEWIAKHARAAERH